MVEVSGGGALASNSAGTTGVGAPGDSTADTALLPQLKAYFGLFWSSPSRMLLTSLVIAIVVVICITVFAQLRLNSWYRDFYNAIESRNLSAFVVQLLVFAAIVIGLLVLNVTQTWLNLMIKLRLRERLTRDLVGQWLVPKRDFLLTGAGIIGRNPDQRIHEDAHHLTELTTDLAVGLMQAFLLLISFIGVLWVLSRGVSFTINHQSFVVPGYMVWCAVLYALVGSLLSWLVGKPLIGLNVERYAREADLRFELVRTNENIDGISLYRGETSEGRRLNVQIDHLITILRRIVVATTRLISVTAAYGWFAIVIPILAAAPGYFEGHLSFGDLMMVAGAFNQVQQSLRWFVDNFGTIADWRATLRRVMDFRQSLVKLDKESRDRPRIAFSNSTSNKITFENITVTLADGSAALQPALIDVCPGQHLLIYGKTGSGKSCLFRAIAGLWPWGSGLIHLPADAHIMFLPQRPYVQPGLLRESLCYGLKPPLPSDASLVSALHRVNLGHLVGSLDKTARWDKDLTPEAQQRLSVARLLLVKPDFVFLDEAFDAIEEDYRPLILSIFENELKNTAFVCVTRHAGSIDGFRPVAELIHAPRQEKAVEPNDKTNGSARPQPFATTEFGPQTS